MTTMTTTAVTKETIWSCRTNNEYCDDNNNNNVIIEKPDLMKRIIVSEQVKNTAHAQSHELHNIRAYSPSSWHPLSMDDTHMTNVNVPKIFSEHKRQNKKKNSSKSIRTKKTVGKSLTTSSETSDENDDNDNATSICSKSINDIKLRTTLNSERIFRHDSRAVINRFEEYMLQHLDKNTISYYNNKYWGGTKSKLRFILRICASFLKYNKKKEEDLLKNLKSSNNRHSVVAILWHELTNINWHESINRKKQNDKTKSKTLVILNTNAKNEETVPSNINADTTKSRLENSSQMGLQSVPAAHQSEQQLQTLQATQAVTVVQQIADTAEKNIIKKSVQQQSSSIAGNTVNVIKNNEESLEKIALTNDITDTGVAQMLANTKPITLSVNSDDNLTNSNINNLVCDQSTTTMPLNTINTTSSNNSNSILLSSTLSTMPNFLNTLHSLNLNPANGLNFNYPNISVNPKSNTIFGADASNANSSIQNRSNTLHQQQLQQLLSNAFTDRLQALNNELICLRNYKCLLESFTNLYSKAIHEIDEKIINLQAEQISILKPAMININNAMPATMLREKNTKTTQTNSIPLLLTEDSLEKRKHNQQIVVDELKRVRLTETHEK